MLKLIIGAKS